MGKLVKELSCQKSSDLKAALAAAVDGLSKQESEATT
jgi:hypothetical protein